MAIVWQRTLSRAEMGSILIPYLENNWTWAGGKVTSGSNTYFHIDTAKTIGIRYNQGSGYDNSRIYVNFKGADYHNTSLPDGTTFIVEITDTAMIISYVSGSISATNCEKIIICNGVNANTGDEEQMLIYLSSKASSNVSAIYASDVTTPADIAEQDGNANVNAKTTNLIPFYNPASAFITTDVFKSLCEDIGAWYFGNVMVNNKVYRMSGSVFARDI